MHWDESFRRAESRRNLPETAAAWVIREHLHGLNRREARALRLWLGLSRANTRAYLRSEVTWRMAGALTQNPPQPAR